MATAKKTEEPTPEEETPAEESKPTGGHVCARCGEPATMVSSSKSYSPAYYCDEHARAAVNEPTKPINA